MNILGFFFNLIMPYFLLHSWRIVWPDIEFLGDRFLFQHLKNVFSLPFHLYGFRREICCDPRWYSYISMHHFSLLLFNLFSLSLFFFLMFKYEVSCCGSLWIYPVWDSLDSLYLYFYVFHQIWNMTKYYFLEHFHPTLSPLLLLRNILLI